MMLGTETEDSHRTADAAGAPRRADYGAVRLGQRDIDGLILCAEHFGAPYDLLAAALGAQPARLRGITARWHRAGYAARLWLQASPGAGPMTSCRRGRTASRRSGPTCGPPPAASAAGPASSSSPSPATESAPWPASTTACSHGSGCRNRSRADNRRYWTAMAASTSSLAARRAGQVAASKPSRAAGERSATRLGGGTTVSVVPCW